MERRYPSLEDNHFLVCIDPGVHQSGVAFGIVDGEESVVTDAATVDSNGIYMWVSAIASLCDPSEELDIIWCAEKPQAYRTFGVAHDDLDDLKSVLEELPIMQTWTPAEWKGNPPKKVHHLRVSNFLSDQERELFLTLDHNAKDAVALWLWAAGKLNRGGVRPRKY